ncbi:MAG: HNH endonuclease [Desulfobaccales bacterium]
MPLNQKTKREILERDNYKCQICGREINSETAQIDHIIPLSKGGTDEPANMQTVCPKCNMIKADKIIDIVSTPLSKQLAKAWIFFFRKAPILTAVISIFITILGLVYSFYFGHLETIKQEKERKENLSYYDQINQLDSVERNIKQLLGFVKQQRIQLRVTEDALLSLQSERDRLKPLVESDRKVVEAIFIAQEQRAQNSINKERLIGFGLGFLASVVASAIMLVINYFIRKRRSE